MKLYLSNGDSFLMRHLYESAHAADMVLDNERQHGSRYADTGSVIEFNGYGNVHGTRSARRPNTRSMWIRENEYAATWDQWGILLSRLFVLDPTMKVGGHKRPYYRDADDFHFKTNDRFKRRFELADLSDFHGDHTFRFSGTPGEHHCIKCSAVQRWQIGGE